LKKNAEGTHLGSIGRARPPNPAPRRNCLGKSVAQKALRLNIWAGAANDAPTVPGTIQIEVRKNHINRAARLRAKSFVRLQYRATRRLEV